MDTEHLRLASEVNRLEIEIEKTRNHGGSGVVDEMMATCRGRELLRELKVVLHRQAELEETERVKSLVQKAIDTKFVETPMMLRNIGECPLCLKDTHEVTMNQDNRAVELLAVSSALERMQ
jgi:hypothetical protein